MWGQVGFELLLSLIIIAKALEYVEQWWRGPSRPFLIMQYGKQWHCLPILSMYNYIKITWIPYHFYNWTLWCNWYEFNHTWLPTQHTWVTRRIPVKHQTIQYLNQTSAQCTSQAKEWPGLSSCRRTRRWARGGSRRWRRRWSWSPSPSSSFIPSGPGGKCFWCEFLNLDSK